MRRSAAVRPLPFRAARRVGLGVAVLLVLLGVPAVGAWAATKIVEPSSSPYDVPAASPGKPAAFTVTVSGFDPYQSVYVEQCNGRGPGAPDWQPSLDCDIGSSPAAAIADTKGVATFAADDANHAFHPFVGTSPEQLFNCLPPGGAAPKNGLKSYDDCQVRVSSNNTAATTDQQFLALRLPGADGSSGDSGGGSNALVFVVAGLVVLLIIGAFVLIRRRSRRPVA